MYRIDFSDKAHAVSRIYDFMTIPLLNMPECTVWGEAGPLMTITKDTDSFMLKDEFSRRLLGKNFAAVSCVASTDKADQRRVVLTFTQGLNFMVLNFPAAVNGLNASERKVLDYLDGNSLQ